MRVAGSAEPLLGALWPPGGDLGAWLGRPWASLAPPGMDLSPPLAPTGQSLGPLWCLLGSFGAALGPPWRLLGFPGAALGPPGRLLGSPGAALGPQWRLLGSPGRLSRVLGVRWGGSEAPLSPLGLPCVRLALIIRERYLLICCRIADSISAFVVDTLLFWSSGLLPLFNVVAARDDCRLRLVL